MKICFINTLYHPNVRGGAERSVKFLAEALVHAGHEAVVICTMPESGTHMATINGVKVYYLKLKNLYYPFRDKSNPIFLKPFWHAIDTYNPFMARELGLILAKEHPDLVHTNNLCGFSVAVLNQIKLRGLPLVHTLRDYYLICPRSMYRKGTNCETQCWSCKLYALPRKKVSNLIDSIVGNSRFLIDRHLQFGYFKDISSFRVIYNAYKLPKDMAFNHPSNDTGLRLGYLGSLHPNKGLEILLKILTRFSPEQWELWIGGKGIQEYESYLKNSYSFPNVHYLGFIQPAILLAKVDVLVVPSLWHDPLPRTIFEAYAHGIPVIGSRRGGIPEIIEEKKTGFIFDPDYPEELEAEIKRFIQDRNLAVYMRANVLKKAQEFLPEKIISEYLKVYHEVLY